MSQSTSSYPSLSVDTTGTVVVSHAGSVLLLRAAEKSGLAAGLSAALAPWRKPLASHDPGKILLDLAISVAVGGDCLADLGQLRAHPEMFGPVASDPTVSRLITELAGDEPRVLSAINAARATARRHAWKCAGADAPDHEINADHPLVIDLDATLVTAHSPETSCGTNLQAWLRVPPVMRVRRPRPLRHRRTGGHTAAAGQRRREHRR